MRIVRLDKPLTCLAVPYSGIGRDSYQTFDTMLNTLTQSGSNRAEWDVFSVVGDEAFTINLDDHVNFHAAVLEQSLRVPVRGLDRIVYRPRHMRYSTARSNSCHAIRTVQWRKTAGVGRRRAVSPIHHRPGADDPLTTTRPPLDPGREALRAQAASAPARRWSPIFSRVSLKMRQGEMKMVIFEHCRPPSAFADGLSAAERQRIGISKRSPLPTRIMLSSASRVKRNSSLAFELSGLPSRKRMTARRRRPFYRHDRLACIAAHGPA